VVVLILAMVVRTKVIHGAQDLGSACNPSDLVYRPPTASFLWLHLLFKYQRVSEDTVSARYSGGTSFDPMSSACSLRVMGSMGEFSIGLIHHVVSHCLACCSHLKATMASPCRYRDGLLAAVADPNQVYGFGHGVAG
jgi:hypothetical protein